MSGKEYKRTKQYIVNELGLGKELIRIILKEEIEKVAKELAGNYIESNAFYHRLSRAVTHGYGWDNTIRAELLKIISEQIKEKFDIKVDINERVPQNSPECIERNTETTDSDG